MATKLTKKQRTQLTEKLAGIVRENNALQLRLSMDNSVNEMNVNQISGALNRIHGQAIGKELPAVVTIPVKQLGSGDPSPDNIRPIVSYEIDGIGTVYGGELNIETGVLTVTYAGVDLGTLEWGLNTSLRIFFTNIADAKVTASIRGLPIQCSELASAYEFSYTGWANQPEHSISAGNNYSSGRLNTTVKSSEYTNVAAFTTAMTGVILVYELATPEIYTLTPEQMLQLLDQL